MIVNKICIYVLFGLWKPFFFNPFHNQQMGSTEENKNTIWSKLQKEVTSYEKYVFFSKPTFRKSCLKVNSFSFPLERKRQILSLLIFQQLCKSSMASMILEQIYCNKRSWKLISYTKWGILILQNKKDFRLVYYNNIGCCCDLYLSLCVWPDSWVSCRLHVILNYFFLIDNFWVVLG